MGKSLLKTIKGYFTEQVVTQLSATVDESEASVQQMVAKTAPLVLNHLLARTEWQAGVEVLSRLTQEAYQAGVLSHLGDLQVVGWQHRGLDLMQGLLGEAYTPTLNRLATTTLIDPLAARTLLSTVTAAVLAALGQHAADHQLTAAQLTSYLQSQKEDIKLALPFDSGVRPAMAMAGSEPTARPAAARPAAPVSNLSAEGPGTWAPVGGGYTFTPTPVLTTESRASSGLRWQWGLLLLVAVGLGYYFGRGQLSVVPGTATYAATPLPATAGQPAAAGAATATARGHYDSSSDTYIYDTGQPILLKLADGTTQKIGSHSTEAQLYTFLSDATNQVDSVNRTKGWINFDRVYFEPSKAVLTPESSEQLQRVARILKTFPQAVVKIGGYTDSTGSALQNLHLSDQRAHTALLALADMGVPVANLQAKGYGDKHSLTSNATPEGRALNRRISIRVVKK